MIQKMLGTLLVLGGVMTLPGCVTDSQTAANTGQPALATSSPADAEPMVERLLAPGTTYTIRITKSDGSVESNTWKVMEPSQYRDKAVTRISDPSGSLVNVFNAANRNWMATLRNGKELAAAEPDNGAYEWPLKVGKSWEGRFTYSDKEKGRSWSPVVTEWTVARTETITVPAGTFNTFRLNGTPGKNNAERVSKWLDPQTGIVVKMNIERLPYHYLGAGTETDELVEFHAPEK